MATTKKPKSEQSSRTRASQQTAAPLVPPERDLAHLRAAARDCLACDLGPPADQTVFGEGPQDASLIMVGEQPGDEEDRVGRPFVGPAGRLLDRALQEAGVDRKRVYVTNAVKHFAFVFRGKRRLHSKPHMRHVTACHPWLAAELEAVSAPVVVCLGATAAKALLGSGFRLTQEHGRVIEGVHGKAVVATYHPSAALRARDAEARKATYDTLVSALVLALRTARERGPG